MKSKISLSVLIFCLSYISISQEIYSKIGVPITNKKTIETLKTLSIPLDHLQIEDQHLILYVNQDEIVRLNQHNALFEVIIPDYREYYQKMLKEDSIKMSSMNRSNTQGGGFGLGSMGGFYTLSEVEDKLDEMYANYPSLITQKVSIGTTFEGREIWMVKISDNPTVNEAEPKAYFDALHHAREPLSMSVALNYMFWLLENYGIDEQVTYLLDNRELYFVPIVNPDGYEYNRLTEPNGGGFWRKNRKIISGSSCIGIDLNRNYDITFGFDDFCSSPNPCSDIYRGEFVFSEEETIAVRDFVTQINPASSFTIHSTAGSYIMPIDLNYNFTEFGVYSEWASDFLSENDYIYGAGIDLIGYMACGTTDQYLYNQGIHTWTPEIGGQGFWPPPSTILDLVEENVHPMFFQSWIAGGYVDVQSHSITGNPLPGETITLTVESKNIGLDTALDVSVAVSADHPSIVISASQNYGNIFTQTRQDNSGNPFTIEIPSNFEENSFILTLTTFQEGVENKSIDITIPVANKNVLFFDDAESGSSQWTASGNNLIWSLIDDDSYSGNFSFGDSEERSYLSGTTNFFTLNTTFDFSDTVNPIVSFMTKNSFALNDNATFSISTNNGVDWEILKVFERNESWNLYQQNLENYNGFNQLRFRFSLNSDGFNQSDGFYFDDFEIADYNDNFLDLQISIEKEEIQLYPNPIDNELLISLSNFQSGIWHVNVFDLQGRKIMNKADINSHTASLQMASLKTGVYLVQIEFNGVTLTKRVLKI
ncbi:MAG: M14 family zinc carboxypeptidase [Flavobacteriaceae bacterium]